MGAKAAVVASLVATIASSAQAQDCKSIADSAARLACLFGPKTDVAKPMAGLGFQTVKRAMNAKYPTYFAHHNTTLIGSRTSGDNCILD